MKRQKKMLIVDVIILLICMGVFTILKLSGIIAIIVTIFVAVVLHTFLNYQFKKKEIIEKEVKQPSLKEQVRRLEKDYPRFEELINRFAHQTIEFEERQKALKKLIELNKGEKGTYLMERSQEAEQFLLQNCNQFEKCLVVLEVLDSDDTEYQENEEAIEEIIEKIENLVDVYSKFLSEVRRMGNGLNLNDPGLKSAVEKLESIRNEAETKPQKGLFVVSGKEF